MFPTQKKSSKNRTNPYLGCLTSGAPDLEGKNRKKRKKGKNEVIKRHGKEKNHCHNVGLQFVTDILGQTWMSEFELKAKNNRNNIRDRKTEKTSKHFLREVWGTEKKAFHSAQLPKAIAHLNAFFSLKYLWNTHITVWQ